MSIATDPNSVSLDDEQEGFAQHFEEFASGKKPDPDPEKEKEPTAPDGNGPEEEPPVPEEEPKPEEAEAPEPAAEQSDPPETATSGEAKPEGGDQPPEGEAPDPWASAPEDLKAEYQKVLKERDEAKHKANSDANRVAALSRKLQQVSAGQTSSATPAPDAQPTEAQKALDEKIGELRKNYGEIADPLIELIETQRKELNQVRANITGLNEAQQAQVIAHETAALETAHPDWRDVANSPDFAGWLEIQPENIQRLATSWDARETSVVLTLFKAERIEATGLTEQQGDPAPAPKADAATGVKRSQQLDGGRDVRSRPAPAASEPPDDFDAAFKYFEEKRRLKAQQARPR